MVTPVSSLHMGGHSCLTPWIFTKPSSIRRCKCSDVLKVRTGNSNYWWGYSVELLRYSQGNTYILLVRRLLCQNVLSLFCQSTVKIKRLQDLLTTTQDVSDTAKFQKTPQKSLQWKLMDAWFIEDWILLPSHYPGSLQKCCQSLWYFLETVTLPASFRFIMLLTDSVTLCGLQSHLYYLNLNNPQGSRQVNMFKPQSFVYILVDQKQILYMMYT